MNCPRCNVELKNVTVKDMALDICNSCDGIWLDKDELIKVTDKTIEELKDSSISPSLELDKTFKNVENKLLCPKCNSLMANYIYSYDSKVRIDSCKVCKGIWLDDGEIKKIIEYLAEVKSPLPPEKLVEINSKLQEINLYYKTLEQQIIDDLVKSDEKSGLTGFSRKILQFIYNFLYKLGL